MTDRFNTLQEIWQEPGRSSQPSLVEAGGYVALTGSEATTGFTKEFPRQGLRNEVILGAAALPSGEIFGSEVE